VTWRSGVRDFFVGLYLQGFDFLLPYYHQNPLVFSGVAMMVLFFAWPFLGGLLMLAVMTWIASSCGQVSIAYSIYNNIMKAYRTIKRYVAFLVVSFRSLIAVSGKHKKD